MLRSNLNRDIDLDLAPPSWNALQRQKWMAERLGEKRKFQRTNGNLLDTDTATKIYRPLLSQFIEVNNTSVIFEVISDGLGNIEPYWYGLRTTFNSMEVLTEADYIEYRNYVADHREGKKLPYKTQHAIGETLYEPTLFRITKKRVKYYYDGTWYPLDDSKCPLPLKRAGDEQKSRSRIIKDIEHSLAILQQDVLWPALLRPSSTAKLMSLVLIQSSMWQVTGVWALHVSSLGRNYYRQKMTDSYVSTITNPPVHCLHDVLGATLQRDSTHRHRIIDVNLFRRCKGYLEIHSPREVDEEEIFRPAKGESDEEKKEKRLYDQIYNRDFPPPERPERYRQIYRRGCRALAPIEEPENHSGGELFSRVARALESTFVGWHLGELLLSSIEVRADFNLDRDSLLDDNFKSDNCSKNLRQEFLNHRVSLSKNTTLQNVDDSTRLIIDAGNKEKYLVRKDGHRINIYEKVDDGPEVFIHHALQLCFGVLNHFKTNGSSHAYGEWIESRLKNSLYNPEGLNNVDIMTLPRLESKEIAKLLAISLLWSTFVETENTRSWLSWCCAGLRVLIFSVQEKSEFPFRQDYNSWRENNGEYDGSTLSMTEALKGAGLDDETIFFLIKLVDSVRA